MMDHAVRPRRPAPGPSTVTPCRSDPSESATPPGLDLPAVTAWLDAAPPGPARGLRPRPRSSRAAARTSPTSSTTAARRLVLRRPPLGHVLATAHDMTREYRVLSALHGTAVPVPRAAGALRGRRRHRRALLRDDLRRRGRRPRCGGRAGAAARRPFRRGRGDDGHPRRPACRRPRRGRAGRLRPAGGVHGAAGAPLGRPARRLPQPRPARRRRRCGRRWPRRCRRPSRRPTATIVHGDYRLDNLVVGPARRGRRLRACGPCSTGRWRRWATRSPTSGC